VAAVVGTKVRTEVRRFREEARNVPRDVTRIATEQQADNPLDPDRQTIFLLITCGQAVRNFLLSDVLMSMKRRYNVVILSPYGYSDEFRGHYTDTGVHVLPWFSNFRSVGERLFHYYFMSRSPSRTHQGWLANLETRAEADRSRRSRYRRLRLVKRASDVLGSLIGWRGMQGLYGSYFMAYLPKSLFRFLFSTYRPALVISTTAHHPEAWPLTFFGRRYGARTLGNILSWDNTSTKPIMDISCDYYAVWSDGMKEEFLSQFPHIRAEVRVTGCPLFDIYYNRSGATSRDAFLEEIGLDPAKPYIFYATNTPAAMPDEGEVVRQYWEALNRSPLAGKVNMLLRLHPKDNIEKYQNLIGSPGLAVTLAAKPHWDKSDHWLPNHDDMDLLLNSMLHAAVSVNVASTMSLESFALELPTINVGFRSETGVKDHSTMWSFDMYHFSEHYRAIVENGSVELARSVDELVEFTRQALESGPCRAAAMRKTLEEKAAFCDGSAARRFFEVVEEVIASREQVAEAVTGLPAAARPMPLGQLPAAAE
jgi:hypothetical protein